MSTACGGGSIMECARRHRARVDGLGTRRRSLNHQRVERGKPRTGNEEMTSVTRKGDGEAKVVKLAR